MSTDSALYIVLIGLLLTLTSLYITILRGKLGTLHGDGEQPSLARARRAHYTVLEFSVPFIALLVTYDIGDGSAVWIQWLSIAFLVTRLSHVLYMYKFGGLHITRGIGTVGSHAVNVILIVLILINLFG